MLKSDLFRSGSMSRTRQLKLTPEFRTSACKTHRANANRTVYTGCNWSGRRVDVWRLLTDFLSHCYSGAVHKHFHMSDRHTHTPSTYITLTAVCWWVAAVIAAGLLCGANTDRLTNTNRSALWETARADVDENAVSRPSEMLRCSVWKMQFFVAAIWEEEFFFGSFWTWDVLTFGLFTVPCCCKTSPRTFVCNREKLDSSLFFFFFFNLPKSNWSLLAQCNTFDLQP